MKCSAMNIPHPQKAYEAIANNKHIKQLLELKSLIYQNAIPKSLLVTDGKTKVVYSDGVYERLKNLDEQITFEIENIKFHYGCL